MNEIFNQYVLPMLSGVGITTAIIGGIYMFAKVKYMAKMLKRTAKDAVTQTVSELKDSLITETKELVEANLEDSRQQIKLWQDKYNQSQTCLVKVLEEVSGLMLRSGSNADGRMKRVKEAIEVAYECNKATPTMQEYAQKAKESEQQNEPQDKKTIPTKPQTKPKSRAMR